MRYIWHHIQTILDNYTCAIPLSHFLKNYFKLHRKLGSRDRKIISDMAYSWYRCSTALASDLGFEIKMQACLFLSDNSTPSTRQFIPQEWDQQLDTKERIAFLSSENILTDIRNIALFNCLASEGISKDEWLRSMLRQPRLFIRIRKRKDDIIKLLRHDKIPFEEMDNTCLSLPNGAAVDKLLPPEAYVVQDHSSQQTGLYFNPMQVEEWWDCCSGAGGKSLLLKDVEPSVHLTVSDKRSSILHNLNERFRLYKHNPPKSVVVDATDRNELEKNFPGKQFDNIICDVPCTGSGTWARTPEQLYFFKEEYINEFAERQKQIVANVLSYLKPGGRMIYITCSIFREENEEVIEHVLKSKTVSLLEKTIINGIEKKADSMFVAVLRKEVITS